MQSWWIQSIKRAQTVNNETFNIIMMKTDDSGKGAQSQTRTSKGIEIAAR